MCVYLALLLNDTPSLSDCNGIACAVDDPWMLNSQWYSSSYSIASAIDCRNLGITSVSFTNLPTQSMIVYLDKNSITYIAPAAFSNAPQLSILYVDACRLFQFDILNENAS